MNLFESGDPRPIHFMGIAGAGMSGLALLARHQGAAVTGCDKDPQGAADLAALGVEIWRGHDPGHVSGARAVVVTAAVPREHPELEQAGALGIPVVRRADALGQAVANGTVVGVAGTHGKTTTTAMVTEALAAAGRNPTGLAGGRVAPWGGNARLGGRELFVVEADEFDRAFLSLAPAVAVVNNVEADHLECYGTVQALEDAFVQFAGGARRVIAGADDGGAGRVAKRVSGPVWRVGLAREADVRIADPELDDAGSRARVVLPDGRELRLALRVPGLHNLRNAGAALAVACELGADLEACLTALARFAGVARRFERVGEARGVPVVDDYAHHPTEVRATLAAARQAFPRRRVVAVFQPHLYSRTALHGEALGRELAAADVVVVAPVYAAREQPIPGVTADLVARGAALAGATTVAVRERTALTERVARTVRAGDVVFTLGAGDITAVGPELLPAGGVAALAAWFGAPPLLSRVAYFQVRQVELVGLKNLPPDGVIAALRLPLVASVFTDTRLLADRVKGLTGVADAQVVRRLPGALQVIVREVAPVALVPGPRGSLVAVDGEGRTLPFDPTRAALDLPIAASGDAGVAALLALIQSVDPALFQTITAARVMARSDVLLESGARRVLVRRDAGLEVIRAVVTVAQDLAAKGRPYAELDARFAGQVIVRRKGGAGGAKAG